MSEPHETTARLHDEAASELGLAAAHCRTAARHFRDRLVPPGAAHAWAALGHLREAEQRVDAQAREHARRSNADPA